MDSHDNETTNDLLRKMWQQLVATHNALCTRIDATNARLEEMGVALSTRIDDTNTTLRAFMRQTHDNLDRVDRNAERSSERIEGVNNSLSSRIDAMANVLSSRIDAMNNALSSRIDQTNATLEGFKAQTHENFGRVQRNFEKVHSRLEVLETGQTRMNELDARLTRVEAHVGLRDE